MGDAAAAGEEVAPGAGAADCGAAFGLADDDAGEGVGVPDGLGAGRRMHAGVSICTFSPFAITCGVGTGVGWGDGVAVGSAVGVGVGFGVGVAFGRAGPFRGAADATTTGVDVARGVASGVSVGVGHGTASE